VIAAAVYLVATRPVRRRLEPPTQPVGVSPSARQPE
jgi:hypothetical protein